MGQTCEACTNTEKDQQTETLVENNSQGVVSDKMPFNGANKEDSIREENPFRQKEGDRDVMVKDSEVRAVKEENKDNSEMNGFNNVEKSIDYNVHIKNHLGSEIKLARNEKRESHVLPDKSRFEGELVNGLPENYGKLIMPNGDEYLGYFIRGKKNGTGRLQKNKGFLYHGDFENNRINGYGVMKHPNGEKYTGFFKNGSYHGEGEIVYPDGTAKKGEWKYGEYVNADKAIFEGYAS